MTDVMGRHVLKGLIVMVVLASLGSYAQEQSESQDNDNQEQTEPKKADEKQPPTGSSTQAKKDKGRDGEIFRPSEEISEDFAVSFPVDI